MTLEQIGQIIRLGRKAKGWTQPEAAEQCGISLSSYKSIELAKGAAGMQAYNTVAETLDVSFSLTFPIKKK